MRLSLDGENGWISLEFPMESEKLKELLDKNEYVFSEGILGYEKDIIGFNEFIMLCQKLGISDEEVFLLDACDFEPCDVLSKKYAILPFSKDTANWHFSNGGDIQNSSDVGVYLCEKGYLKPPFEFEMLSEQYSWINWEYALSTLPDLIICRYEEQYYIVLTP